MQSNLKCTKASKFLSVPSSKGAWLRIASDFERTWNIPHCLGAIDGKHVVIQAPGRSGSDCFNYKKSHSSVPLAVCDANYEFAMVDIGDSGRQSDGGVYANSKLGYAIENDILNIPDPDFIANSGNNTKFPYVFVADDASSLKPYMIRPYPVANANDPTKLICSYRISRAKRMIENSFRNVTSRFRSYWRPIIAKVTNVCGIVKATVALRNFLMPTKPDDARHQHYQRHFKDTQTEIGFSGWTESVG